MKKSNSPKFRPANGRRFFGKSKSAAVSRSSSSNRLMAEKIYINSSDDHLSTSETDELNSDDDSKLVYKTCLESPVKSMYLKKSLSRPDQYASIDQPDTNRRFMKNNRLRTSKSTSYYKNESFQKDDLDNEDEEDEEEEENEKTDQENLFYYKLDGRMKTGKLSRFKVIKSKSNSALQPVRANCK